MSDFKIGDRVRAKHDHTFEGEADAPYYDFTYVQVGVRILLIPTSWLEPVPKPLNPLVPWGVLREVFDLAVEQYRPGERNIGFITRELRERGYGPAEETR